MIKLIITEFWKLKRYSVLWIGISAMLCVVLLTRFMAIASDGTIHTLKNFSNNVIWNNITLIYPATITLITGYIIERERTDNTLKNLMSVPLSFRYLLIGKLITSGFIAIFLAIIQFIFMLIVFHISRFPEFGIASAIISLCQMVGANLFAYIAVLPIIIFTSQRCGCFMIGVTFAFFYGFAGTFAAGHGLTNLYPISASLGLISYQGDGVLGRFNIGICFTVIISLILISVIMLIFSRDRVKNTYSYQKNTQ